MTVLPGQQNVSTFQGGTYNAPQMLSPQIPGQQVLPQIYSPNGYQSGAINTPQANPFNSSLLNAIGSGAQNSGSNHAISSGGYNNMPAANSMSSMSQMSPLNGLFGK